MRKYLSVIVTSILVAGMTLGLSPLANAQGELKVDVPGGFKVGLNAGYTTFTKIQKYDSDEVKNGWDGKINLTYPVNAIPKLGEAPEGLSIGGAIGYLSGKKGDLELTCSYAGLGCLYLIPQAELEMVNFLIGSSIGWYNGKLEYKDEKKIDKSKLGGEVSIEVTYPVWESVSIGGQLGYRYADIAEGLDASGVFTHLAISYKF